MPPVRYALLLAAVIALAGATVAIAALLPLGGPGGQAAALLVPLALAARLALRLAGRRPPPGGR
jgi:hypothetical protein